MKRTFLYFLWVAVFAGLVHAGTGDAPLAAAMPQPSTILICMVGIGFFRFVTKRVP